MGKRVCLPRVADSSLAFHEVRDLPELVPGRFGILEPRPDSPQVSISQIPLLAVPGLGFTCAGDRLGRGGGYYDRVLAGFAGQSVGLCFACQIEKSLPIEPLDRPVNAVLFSEK